MKLIRILGMRRSKLGNTQRWGLFWCSFCKEEKELRINNGKLYQSCDCAHSSLVGKANTTHGDSRPDSEYYGFWIVWMDMKSRCYNPKNSGYSRYGGRGIIVCKNWRFSYSSFKEWMLSLEQGWTKGLTIDRIDNDGNYEPTNCRFVTQAKNSHNRSSTKLNWLKVREIRKKYASGNYTQKALAEEYKICQQNISRIINNKIWKELQEE